MIQGAKKLFPSCYIWHKDEVLMTVVAHACRPLVSSPIGECAATRYTIWLVPRQTPFHTAQFTRLSCLWWYKTTRQHFLAGFLYRLLSWSGYAVGVIKVCHNHLTVGLPHRRESLRRLSIIIQRTSLGSHSRLQFPSPSTAINSRCTKTQWTGNRVRNGVSFCFLLLLQQLVKVKYCTATQEIARTRGTECIRVCIFCARYDALPGWCDAQHSVGRDGY